MTTRRTLLLAGLGSLTTAALGTRMAARAAGALQTIKVVIPAESVFVLNYMGAKDAGVFAKHGIDLDVDARPFAGFLAGLPSKQCMSVTYSGIDAIQKINEGLDWAIIGGGLTVVQDVIVAKNSPYKTAADLRGKKFGTFSTGAGSFKAARAAMIEAFKLDVDEGHPTAAGRRAGFDQASGKRSARRHDQHLLAQPCGGSASG